MTNDVPASCKLTAMPSVDRSRSRAWVREAVDKIDADFNRSSDTHLVPVAIPALPDIDFYLKDESTHPTGSLKHRLARSLFLYGLCNGFIDKDTIIVEASSGSTAISEAYFARLLGLRFIAVVPNGIAREKVRQIEHYGGECREVAPAQIYAAAQALADNCGGHYMDQFTYAERATDWRGNNNIAESLFAQMSRERFPIPSWIVVGAGTGGTSATLGRYMRYRTELSEQSRLCVVDPERSVFYDYFENGDNTLTGIAQSRIDGIGRPRVEPSFCAEVIDRMIRVRDAATIATLWWLAEELGRRCGGSTGTAVYGSVLLMQEMQARGEHGSVVSMIGDAGDRYASTFYDRSWLAREQIDIDPYLQQLRAFSSTARPH